MTAGDEVRHILRYEWDPLGYGDARHVDEYEHIAQQILALQNSAWHWRVYWRLVDARTNMGLPPDVVRDQCVAHLIAEALR
jgi:hypothetical protein